MTMPAESPLRGRGLNRSCGSLVRRRARARSIASNGVRVRLIMQRSMNSSLVIPAEAQRRAGIQRRSAQGWTPDRASLVRGDGKGHSLERMSKRALRDDPAIGTPRLVYTRAVSMPGDRDLRNGATASLPGQTTGRERVAGARAGRTPTPDPSILGSRGVAR